jgi:hypothetical protein
MKLTKSKLQQIIKEELGNLSEDWEEEGEFEDQEEAPEISSGLGNAIDDLGEELYNFSQKHRRDPDMPNFHKMLQRAMDAVDDSNPKDALYGDVLSRLTV